MYRRDHDSLKIDVGLAKTPRELHHLLFEAFRFPDNYGSNWDAFDECIRDIEVPKVIQITGFEKLPSHLPTEAELMSRCIDDFVSEREQKIVVHFA
jgi:ribonuclease inhibitor